MTKKDCLKILAIMSANYSQFNKNDETQLDIFATTMQSILSNYDFGLVQCSLLEWIGANNKFAPSVGELKEGADALSGIWEPKETLVECMGDPAGTLYIDMSYRQDTGEIFLQREKKDLEIGRCFSNPIVATYVRSKCRDAGNKLGYDIPEYDPQKKLDNRKEMLENVES